MRLTAECAETLAHYCRAWRRQGVRFGITGAHRRLEHYEEIFPVCCGTPESMPGETEGETMERVVLLSGDALIFRFPHGHPERERRGRINDGFLDGAAFREEHARLFASPSSRTTVLIPLPRIYLTEGITPAAFIRRLALFLDALPPGFRPAVELENREFLLPAYFDMLREHGAVPAVTGGMPEPSIVSEGADAGGVIIRTAAGRDRDLAAGIRHAVHRGSDAPPMIILLEDRTDTALMAFAGLMEQLNGELARRSVIRRRIPESHHITC
jgi:hypothetical protein